MHSIYDAASAATVLDQPLDPKLRSLIMDRLSDAQALGLNDLTHILVVEPGDTEAEIVAEIGWSPLAHPIEGWHFGTADFVPYWAWLEDVGGWYEMLHPVGNSGFAYVLLIKDALGTLPELLVLCGEGVGQCA